MAKRLDGSFGLIHWRGKKLFNAPIKQKILLTLLLVYNNPQIIRTNVENRHERFCKKDRRPVKPWRRQKGGKGVAQVAGKHPTDIYCLSQLAGTLLYQEKFDEALCAIQEAEAVQPTFPLVRYYKGKILLCNYKTQESIKSWDFLLHTPLENFVDKEYGINKKRIKSLKNDALLYKSMCHYCLGHVKEAKEYAEQHLAGRSKGQESDFTKNYVENYTRELNYSRVTPEDIIDGFDGDTTDAQFKRISAHIDKLKEQGNRTKLIKYFKRKTREFPKCYYLWTIMSEYCFDYRLKGLCLKSAEKAHALEDTGNDMLVLYDYGAALFLNGRYDEAIAVFDKILAEDINYIAYGEHGEGMRWTKKLLADAKVLRNNCMKRKADPTR